MANAQHFPSQSNKHEHKRVFGKFVGAGTSNGTGAAGIVTSATRTGAGAYTLVLTPFYPELVFPDIKVVGPTKLTGTVLTCNPQTGAMTIELQVPAGTATDATTSDTVYVVLDVRNSALHQ